jgi:hypothetical protein
VTVGFRRGCSTEAAALVADELLVGAERVVDDDLAVA